MRRYETILIAHVDLSEDELSSLIARYGGIVTGQKGILVKVERWGKRRLAYLIKKQARGFYILIDYAGESAVVNELERNLKIDDKILKFMTVLKAETVDLAALEKEIAEAAGQERKRRRRPPPPPLRQKQTQPVRPMPSLRFRKKPMRRGKRSHDNDTNICTQRPQRAKTAEEVLSSTKVLPFLYRLDPEDRVQGITDAQRFHDGKGQDHAAADHGKLRKTSAGIDRCHQKGADDRPAALCRIRRITG